MKQRFTIWLLMLSGFLATNLSAQTNQAIIRGTVVDGTKSQVPGATVQVRNESTGFTSATTTNDKGEYIIKQLPLGKPYTIIVSYIGHGEQRKTGYSLNQGDLVTVDFEIKETTTELEAVQVTGTGLKNTVANFGAATSITARDITKLPVNGRNFTSLLDLSPLSRGGSISGQLASSTNYTIDGMTAKNATSGGTTNRNGSPYAISMEAVREFKVVTNQYDVTFGRTGGGAVSTVTKSGTNTLSGSAFVFGRTDWLSSPYDIRGNKRNVPFSTYQYGFSLGGPIVKDKAHFFVVWDHQADSRPLQIADIQTAADEKRFSVTKTSLDRYASIARSKYGVANSPMFGSFDKKEQTESIFARIDWQLSKKHLLTIRNNFGYDKNNQSIGDNSSINTYETYGTSRGLDNSLLFTLRSVVNSRLINEAKLQHMYTKENSIPNPQLPAANIPRAIVERVGSQIEGKDVFTTIQLGGQRYIPEHFYNNTIQFTDNVYYNTNNVSYTFGTDLMYTNMNSLYGSEMNGRFYFTGLDNFENLKPYRYAREIALNRDHSVKQNILNLGVYGQLQTKLFTGFELMAGVRVDYAGYMNRPNFNQTVFNELGLRTDNTIKTFQIQPRANVTWDINERGKDILRFGAGIFGSDINNYAMINNMLFDGTKVASVDIQGANVPTPDFVSYRSNPATAPGVELLNLPGVTNNATINMNGKDAKVPTIYKANVSYNHMFNDHFKMGLSAYATLGRNNYMYVDGNMVDQPFFRLSNEGNRGVFVPAESIATSNGSTDWQKGRKSEKVGRVLELNSKGKVNSFAVVLDATYQYFKDGEITASYTYNDVKDNTSYNGNVANSATLALMVNDDPRDLSRMTYSDNQFRNKLVIYGTLPTFYGVSVGVRYSATGGTRYSLAVGGNVNGDFVNSNDLAYIFDPNNASVSEKYRTGIQTLLDNPEVNSGLKDYIRKSQGKIAERNGGINGFYGTWDLRIAKKFKTFGSQSIEVSADIFNVANLLNKKWGTQDILGKQNIYSLKSFDAATKNYNYDVNPTTGIVVPSGNPYQIQLGLRYAF